MTGRRVAAAFAVCGWLVAIIAGSGTAAAAGPAGTNALIIGFDVSRSVDADDFENAKVAAQRLVESLPADIDVGLVPIGSTATLSTPLRGSREDLIAAIGVLEREDASGDTLLFDSIKVSLDAVADYDDAQILLFTDGENDGGDIRQVDILVPSLQAQPAVVVSAIFINTGEDPPPDLVRVTELTDGGEIYRVDQGTDFLAQITTAFQDAVVLPTVAPPPTPTPTPTRPTPTPSPTPVAAPPPPEPTILPSWLVPVAAGALFVGLIATGFVISGFAGRASSPEARRRRGLEAYTLTPRSVVRPPPPPTRLGDSGLARSAVDVADRLVRSRHAEEPLSRRLQAADLPFRPGEWVLLQVGAAVLLSVLLFALSGGNPLGLLVGLVVGGVGVSVFLSARAQRRRRAFHAALPDTLGLLASSLRVGYSLPQAMDTVAREGQEPIRTEFNRAIVESRLGVPADGALEAIGQRLDSDDFQWVVMAIRIQREVGGNLAELLDTVAETMRERARLRGQVDALSAEGRISAWIIGGLPVVFIIYVVIVRPQYLTPLVTQPLGLLLIALGAALFTGGVIGLRWAIKVDV